jgi:hypothetical protein
MLHYNWYTNHFITKKLVTGNCLVVALFLRSNNTNSKFRIYCSLLSLMQYGQKNEEVYMSVHFGKTQY